MRKRGCLSHRATPASNTPHLNCTPSSVPTANVAPFFTAINNDFANINKHRRMLLTLLNVIAAETEFTSSLGKQVQTVVPVRDRQTHIGIGPPMHLAKKVRVHSEVFLSVVFDEGAVKG
jgi:hypothetical protein